MRQQRPTGMFGFTIVWIGQVVSLLGSGMTWFALTIWAWEMTGQATALALVAFFSFGPTVILSPVAGALVDRWDRKLVMMLSDLAAGLMSVAILVLHAADMLQIWHLYVTGALAGAFGAFQFPAYSAAITTMVDKKQYGRANGMMGVAESASGIFAPIAGGLLLTVVGIDGILVIDIVTFLFAISALLFVYIPRPQETAEGKEGRGSLWHESLYGFRYILARPSLLGLQSVFLGLNLVATLGFTLLAPMILARTGNNEITLGSVQSMMGIGGLVGGLLLSVWGGPKRRVHGVLFGMMLEGLLGTMILGLGAGLLVWSVAAFFSSFFLPFINGSNQAIWQAKVAPDVQGRVFAVRRLIAQISAPVAMLLAGPLADRVFEPMMATAQAPAAFSTLVGSGPGAGMALLFVFSGIASVLVALTGYSVRAVREVESILPDHDSQPAAVPAGEAA